MISKMKILYKKVHQLLSKMAKFKSTINGLSCARLIFWLLVTLYIGVITIRVQGSEDSLLASRTMKIGVKCTTTTTVRSLETKKEDTDGVVVVSGNYIPPVLKFP